MANCQCPNLHTQLPGPLTHQRVPHLLDELGALHAERGGVGGGAVLQGRVLTHVLGHRHIQLLQVEHGGVGWVWFIQGEMGQASMLSCSS